MRMKRLQNVVLLLCCLAAAPLFAQTTIGGGTCTSTTVNGPYGVTLTGRQVTAAGTFTNVMQAVGTANFDGLSKVTLTLTQDNAQAIGSPTTWIGTYSVQANCVGVITITSGGNPTFNLAIYNTGTNFLLTGNDSNYSYSGSGDNQPSGCTTASLSGVYTITGTGYALSSGKVVAAEALSGLVQFDGQGHATAISAIGGSAPAASPLTGPYSVSSNCLGSATLSGNGQNFTMTVSIFNASSVAASGVYLDLASTGFMINGTARAIYGQPTTSSANRPAWQKPFGLLAKLLTGAARKGERV